MASNKDIQLIAHLMRRAAFGATRDEIEAYASKGYEATVEELLDPTEDRWMGEDLVRRFHHEASGMLSIFGPSQDWLYRMITSTAPLQEKSALMWHGIFATGYRKVLQGRVHWNQIRMIARYGMGRFDNLLVELSKDPAMIVWLDNQNNHNGAINENFGRELLELFSMGIGNYTEDDVKECARAFTGWTIGNTEYMVMRSERDSDWPYGRISWHYEYRPEDHDGGEKTFLGQKGSFGGEDIIGIICQQESTARFIARHMYSFFVADEPPVPSWPDTPPRDPQAIDALVQAYFDSNYDIKSMLRVLFASDFFKSESVRYEKMKSPAELAVGVFRLTGEFDRPRHEICAGDNQVTFMGQEIHNPPSVEGWHQGTEWIDTGTLMERINFASEHLGDANKPGVRASIDKIVSTEGDRQSSERLVDLCLDQMGAISVSDETREVLLKSANQGGYSRQNIATILRLTAATPEFQRA